jgi:predicted site-specific integrase-resolvase
MTPPLHIYPDGRLDTKNASLYLGVSVKTMATWRTKGEGPPFIKPTGNRIFYFQNDLDAWINRFDRAASTSESQYRHENLTQ